MPSRHVFGDDLVNVKLVMGDISLDVAKAVIMRYIDWFLPESSVHDNGCGEGAVTEAIFSAGHTPLEVHATDMDMNLVRGVMSVAAKYGQKGVFPACMDSGSLIYPGGYFTHSFANCLVNLCQDPGKVMAEMHRTLKDGGRAFVSCVVDLPYEAPIRKAHEILQPPGVVIRNLPQTAWRDLQFLEAMMRQAGFTKIRVDAFDVDRRVPHLRAWSCAAWTAYGAPKDGWKTEHESYFNRGIDIVLDELSKSDRLVVSENGEWIIRMRVHVAIADK